LKWSDYTNCTCGRVCAMTILHEFSRRDSFFCDGGGFAAAAAAVVLAVERRWSVIVVAMK